MATDDPMAYAGDGLWPQRADDPEWEALIELAGGPDACRKALVEAGVYSATGELLQLGHTIDDLVRDRLDR